MEISFLSRPECLDKNAEKVDASRIGSAEGFFGWVWE
jgi:hypothetical protein